jgi:23S rRNA pseudouridine1911/1915/1917 synthase
MADSASGTRHLVVGEEAAGLRLDRFLGSAVAEMSRQRLKALILAGEVVVDGTVRADPAVKVRAGSRVALTVPPAEDAEPAAEAIPLLVVYEDSDLIVIDKPAGLVVHPGPGNETGTLVNALIAHCGAELSGIGGVKRPGIVHRLDKDTSGLLVVAKSDVAHQELSAQFQAHGRDGRLEREYVAFCWGVFERPAGRIDAAIARSQTNRRKMAVAKPGTGRHAVTHYVVEAVYGGESGSDGARVARVRLRLETGRTHQIRVHLAAEGHPLLGDPVYGAGFRSSEALLAEHAQAAVRQLGRQALHAAVLGFEHPVSGRKLRFESLLPADLARLKDALAAGDAAADVAKAGGQGHAR